MADSAARAVKNFMTNGGNTSPTVPGLLKHTLFWALYIIVVVMADDIQNKTRQDEGSASVGSALPPKKLPRGMILGKDGKP